MSDLNFTADFEQAINEIRKVNNLTEAMTQELLQAAAATIKFNTSTELGRASLQKTGIVIKGMINDTQELTAKLELQSSGWVATSTSIKQATTEKLLSAQASRQLEEAERRRAIAATQAQRTIAAELERNSIQSEKANAQKVKDSIQVSRQLEDAERRRAVVTAQTQRAISAELQKNSIQNEKVTAQKTVVTSASTIQQQALAPSRAAGIVLRPEAQAQVAALSQKVAELGTKAGLTTQQLSKMFEQVKSGNAGNIDTKFSGIVKSFQDLSKVSIPQLPTPNLDKIASYASILSRIQATAANLAIYRTFNILTQSLTGSVSAAHDLQIEISLIRTLTQGSQQSVTQYGEAIKRVSNDTGLAAKDIAELFYDIASNQVAAGAAIEGVALQAARLSRVTKATPQEAGNILSAIANTYGEAAGSIEEQTAKLFKLVDNGRVKLSEVANSIGKALNTGQELGVSFDQIGASLSALTSTGLKTDESMTLLFNIMKSLRNPTKEMSAALLELGYSSGPAAVKTEGLFQILGKIQGLASAGKFDISGLLPDAREQRYFAAFVNDAEKFSRFERDQKNAGASYKGAQDIRGESDADKIAKGLQVFKNAAISTFGNQVTNLVKQFVDLTSKTQDLERTATSLFQKVTVGVITFTAFKTIMSALGALQELQAARAIRLAAATDTATAAQNRNNLASASAGKGGVGALAGASPLLTGVGIFATAATAYLSYKSIVTDGNEELGRSFYDLVERSRQAGLSKELERSVTEGTKLKEVLKEASQSLSKSLGEGITENQSALAAIQDKIRAGADGLKASFSGVTSLTNDRLRDTEQAIGRIRSERERLTKEGQGGTSQDKARDLLQGTLHQYASPFQQLELYQREYQQVQNKINELEKKGTVESLQEADKLSDKKLEIINKYHNEKAKLDHKDFNETVADEARRGIVPLTTTFVYHPEAQEKELSAELGKQLSLRQRIDALLAKQQKEQEDILAKQKIAAEAQKLAIKNYEEFSVHDTNGNVKKEYQTNGKYDEAKAKLDLDRRTAALDKSLNPNDNKILGATDYTGRLNLKKQLDDTNKLKLQDVERTKTGKDLAQAQTTVFEKEKERDALIDKATNSLKEYNVEALKELELLKCVAESLKKTAINAPEEIHDQSLVGGITGTGKDSSARRTAIRLADQTSKEGLTGNRIPDQIKPLYDKAQQQADEIIAEIEKAKSQLKDVSNGKIVDPEEVKRLQARVYYLSTALRNLIQQQIAAEKTGGPRVPTPGFKELDPGNFSSGSAPLNTVDSKLEEGRKNFDKSQPLLQKGLDLTAQAEAVNRVTQTAKEAADSLKGLTGSVAGLQQLIEKATASQPIQPGVSKGGAQPWDWNPFTEERKAYGGPIGKDNQAAWLTGGESVNTVDSTQRFYSRIMQMNNTSRVPQYFNEGGVVTNMGGVKFNINGAGSPKATAREVHNMLKRAKRTGSI